MNRPVAQQNQKLTAPEAIAVLTTPMERQKGRHDKKIGRVIGAAVLSVALAAGVAGMGQAEKSIQAETVLPSPKQKETVKAALPAKQAAEQKAAEPAPEASTPPTSIHTVTRGDTNWETIAEAQRQGLIDPGDIRGRVDDFTERYPNPQPGQKQVVELDHPVDQGQ